MAQKRQAVREAISGLHYGPTCMVYSLRCQSWYCAHVIRVDGDILKISYRGWKEDEEEIHKLSDRLDCSTGGRKKWKGVKGARGAFRRVCPEWIPTGTQLEPAVLLSLVAASARKERKDRGASGQKQQTRQQQLQMGGAGTSQALTIGQSDSALPAGNLADGSDSSEGPGADADDAYGDDDADDAGVSGSRGELHPAKRRRTHGSEAPQGMRTVSWGSHDGLQQPGGRGSRGQSEGPPDKVERGMDATDSAFCRDHRSKSRLAVGDADTRRQHRRRERRLYPDRLLPCQHDGDINGRRNSDMNAKETDDQDNDDYEHQDDDMEEDESDEEDEVGNQEDKEEENVGCETRLGGPAMDGVYRAGQRRAVKRRRYKTQNVRERRYSMPDDGGDDSSSSSSHNGSDRGSDDEKGSSSSDRVSDTARSPASDETELLGSGHWRGRGRLDASSRGRGRGRGGSGDVTIKPESEPTPKLDPDSLVDSDNHFHPVSRCGRGRGRLRGGGRGRGSGCRAAMHSLTLLRDSSLKTYKSEPACGSDVHNSDSRQPRIGRGRRRQPSSLGFEPPSPKSAVLQPCAQQQHPKQQRLAAEAEDGSGSRQGGQEDAGPSQNPAGIQCAAGWSTFALVNLGRRDASCGRGDGGATDFGDASNPADHTHGEQHRASEPADDRLQSKDLPAPAATTLPLAPLPAPKHAEALEHAAVLELAFVSTVTLQVPVATPVPHSDPVLSASKVASTATLAPQFAPEPMLDVVPVQILVPASSPEVVLPHAHAASGVTPPRPGPPAPHNPAPAEPNRVSSEEIKGSRDLAFPNATRWLLPEASLASSQASPSMGSGLQSTSHQMSGGMAGGRGDASREPWAHKHPGTSLAQPPSEPECAGNVDDGQPGGSSGGGAGAGMPPEGPPGEPPICGLVVLGAEASSSGASPRHSEGPAPALDLRFGVVNVNMDSIASSQACRGGAGCTRSENIVGSGAWPSCPSSRAVMVVHGPEEPGASAIQTNPDLRTGNVAALSQTQLAATAPRTVDMETVVETGTFAETATGREAGPAAEAGAVRDAGAAAEVGVATDERAAAEEAVTGTELAATEAGKMEAQELEVDEGQLAGTSEQGFLPLAEQRPGVDGPEPIHHLLASSDEFELQGWPLVMWAAIDPAGTTDLQDLTYRSSEDDHLLVPFPVVGAAAVAEAAAMAVMAAARAARRCPGSAHVARGDGSSPAWEVTEHAGSEGQIATAENHDSAQMEEAQEQDSLLCMMDSLPPLPLCQGLTSEGSLLDVVMVPSRPEVLAQQAPEVPLKDDVLGGLGRASQASELLQQTGDVSPCPGAWAGDPAHAMVETDEATTSTAPPAIESTDTANDLAGIVRLQTAPTGCDVAPDGVAMVGCAAMVGKLPVDVAAPECLAPGLGSEEAAHLGDCIRSRYGEDATPTAEKQCAIEAPVAASEQVLPATLASEPNIVGRISGGLIDESAPSLCEVERRVGQGCQVVAVHPLVAAAATAVAEAEAGAPEGGETEAEAERCPRPGMTGPSACSPDEAAKAVTGSQTEKPIPEAVDQDNPAEHGPAVQEALDNPSLPQDGNAAQALVIPRQSAGNVADVPTADNVAAATSNGMGTGAGIGNNGANVAGPDGEAGIKGARPQQASGRLARLAAVVREAATGLGTRGSVLAAAAAEALGLRHAQEPGNTLAIMQAGAAAGATCQAQLARRDESGNVGNAALLTDVEMHPCHPPSSLDPTEATPRGLLQLHAEPLEPSQPQQIQAQLPIRSSHEEGVGHSPQEEVLGLVPGAATGMGAASPQGPLALTTRQMHGVRRKSSRPQRQRPLEHAAMEGVGIAAVVTHLNAGALLRRAEAMDTDWPQQVSTELRQPCEVDNGHEGNKPLNERTMFPQRRKPKIAGRVAGGHSLRHCQDDQRQLPQLAEQEQFQMQPLQQQQLEQRVDLEAGSNRNGDDGAAAGVACTAANMVDTCEITGGAAGEPGTSRRRAALKDATASSPSTVAAPCSDVPDGARSEGVAQRTHAAVQAGLRGASTGHAHLTTDRIAARNAAAETEVAAARDENDHGGRRTASAQEGDEENAHAAPKTARRSRRRVAERAGANEGLLIAEVQKLRGLLEGQQRRVRSLERELQAEKRAHVQSQVKCKALEEANQQQRRRQSAADADTSWRMYAEKLLSYANRLQGHCLTASETAANIMARLEALPRTSSPSEIPAAASGGNPAAGGAATIQRTRTDATAAAADASARRLKQLEQLCGRLQDTSQGMHKSLLQIQRAEPELWERLLPHLPENMGEASSPMQPTSRAKTLVEEFNALTKRDGAVNTLSEQLNSLATLVEQRAALLTAPSEAAVLAVMPHADREPSVVLRLVCQLPVMLPEEAILVLPKDKVPQEVVNVTMPLSLPKPVRSCQIMVEPQQGLRQQAPQVALAHMQPRATQERQRPRDLEHNAPAGVPFLQRQQQHEMQQQHEAQQQMQRHQQQQQQNARPQVHPAAQHRQQQLEPQDQQQAIRQPQPPPPSQQQLQQLLKEQQRQQQLQPQGPRAVQPQQAVQEARQVQNCRAVSERPTLPPQHSSPPQTRHQRQQQEPLQPHSHPQLRRAQQQYLQQQQWPQEVPHLTRDEQRQQQPQQPRPSISADRNLRENLLAALRMARPSVENETALVAGSTALRCRSHGGEDFQRGPSALDARHESADEASITARVAKRPRAISGEGPGLQVQNPSGSSPERQPPPLTWRQQLPQPQRVPASTLQDLQPPKACGAGSGGASATIVERSNLQPRRHYNEPLQHPLPPPQQQQQQQSGLHRASRIASPGMEAVLIGQYVLERTASQSPSRSMIAVPLPLQFQVEASGEARLVELELGSGQRPGSGSQAVPRAARPASQSVRLVVTSGQDVGLPSALTTVPAPDGLGPNQSRPSAVQRDGVVAARAGAPLREQSLQQARLQVHSPQQYRPNQEPTLVYPRGLAAARVASAQGISRHAESPLHRGGGGVNAIGGGGGGNAGASGGSGGGGGGGGGGARGVDAGGNTLTAQLLQQLAAEAARGGSPARKPRVILMPSEQRTQGHPRGQVDGRFATLDLKAQPASVWGQQQTARLNGAPLRPVYYYT